MKTNEIMSIFSLKKCRSLSSLKKTNLIVIIVDYLMDFEKKIDLLIIRMDFDNYKEIKN
jgi:hypothetical protein